MRPVIYLKKFIVENIAPAVFRPTNCESKEEMSETDHKVAKRIRTKSKRIKNRNCIILRISNYISQII
jgi:hypothetical protein